MMRQEKTEESKLEMRMRNEARMKKRIGEAAQRAALNKLGPGLVATQTTGTLSTCEGEASASMGYRGDWLRGIR